MGTISPPKPNRGPSPTLDTLHEVEEILRAADADDEGPLTLAEIERRMEAKSVRHSTLRSCLDELKRFQLVTEDPQEGVMWTLHEDPEFWQSEDTVSLT